MVPLLYGILLSFCFFSSNEREKNRMTIEYHKAMEPCFSFRISQASQILFQIEASVKCMKVIAVVINLFLFHSKRNKFITTAKTFAHLTLASIWKRIWEACEILKLKHGSMSFWYSIVILFFSLSYIEKTNL